MLYGIRPTRIYEASCDKQTLLRYKIGRKNKVQDTKSLGKTITSTSGRIRSPVSNTPHDTQVRFGRIACIAFSLAVDLHFHFGKPEIILLQTWQATSIFRRRRIGSSLHSTRLG